MEKKKKAIIISGLLILSLFLMVTMIPQNSFIPTLPATSTSPSAIGAGAKNGGESYTYWWNVDFHYRRSILIDNSLSAYDVVNRPIDVFLTFNPNTCHNNSIRVQYWDDSGWLSTPIPHQVWNETYYPTTSYYQSLTLTFYVNVSKQSTAAYYVYYDYENQGDPGYPVQVTSSYASATYTITGDYYTAKITNSTNGGKIYVCTHTTSGNEWSYDQQMHWSPEFRHALYIGPWYFWTDYETSGHSGNAVKIREGTIFIEFNITTNMIGDSTVAGTANIVYRFYRWGWTSESNTNFTEDFSYSWLYIGEYWGNEWRFDTRSMSYMKYEDIDDTVYQESGFTWDGQNIGKAHWLCFWDPNDGEAAGTLDLELPTASKGPYQWYYRLSAPSSDAQKWQRMWPSIEYTDGDWVHEKYAVYIWDGTSGSGPFENFAKGMRSAINVTKGSQEYVFYTVHVHVEDYDNSPLPNANVSAYLGATLNQSTLTDSDGNATLYLYGDTYTLNTTWKETYENATHTIVWKPYIDIQPLIVNKALHNTVTNVEFNQLTTLYCHLIDSDTGEDFASANVSLYQGSPPYNDSQKSNDTGWAIFHVDKAFYNINVTYAGTVLTIDTSTVDLTTGTQTITINCSIPEALEPTHIYCTNGTFVESSWGNDVVLQIYWRNSTDGNINSTAVEGYVNYTLINTTSKNPIPGYVNLPLTPQGTAPDIYYVINLPYTVLVGGEYYTVHVEADDSDGSYLMAEEDIIIYIEPADFYEEYHSSLGPFYWGQSDIFMTISLTYAGNPVNGATISYSLINLEGELKDGGSLSPHASYEGYYEDRIQSTTISDPSNDINVGGYILRFTIQRENFTSEILERSINILPANTSISWEALPSNEGYAGMNITVNVLYKDALFDTDILDASISYYVAGTNLSGSLVWNETMNVYQVGIPSENLDIGVYVMQITARGNNYATNETFVPIIIKAIPTVISAPSFYLSSFVSPDTIYFGPFIQLENNAPFAFVRIKYDAPSSSPVPGASVTVNGIPTIYMGNGYYLALIPTYGLPPGAYPLFVTAEGSGYDPQNPVFFLSVKERSVLIPFVNVRVPLTTFLLTTLAVVVTVSAFTGYSLLKRARIPAIIRRIDELIAAISRGEKVDVKLITRESVISRVLASELDIIGLEPRVEVYVPVELADRLIPLLVESGMAENEAYALAVELKKATPAEREKLLESVGIPGETSARVIEIIEEEEEKAQGFLKPQVKPTEPKPAPEEPEPEKEPKRSEERI